MILTDTVYQRVLALANKEQRGYITPQEFNLFADQAQHEILEQYFYDINQYGRMPGIESEYSNLVDLIDEKLSVFKTRVTNQAVVLGVLNVSGIVPAVYKIGTISSGNEVIQEVKENEYKKFTSSLLTAPSMSNMMYVLEDTATTTGGIRIYPATIASVDITYVRLPARPRWGYVVVNPMQKALYDPSPGKTVNFELHPAEETELVYKILRLAGVAIQRQDVVQAGVQYEANQIQQEKQ